MQKKALICWLKRSNDEYEKRTEVKMRAIFTNNFFIVRMLQTHAVYIYMYIAAITQYRQGKFPIETVSL